MLSQLPKLKWKYIIIIIDSDEKEKNSQAELNESRFERRSPSVMLVIKASQTWLY
jgi:hypothetical protein